MKTKKALITSFFILLGITSVYSSESDIVVPPAGENMDALFNDPQSHLINSQMGIIGLIQNTRYMLRKKPESYELNWLAAALNYCYANYYNTSSSLRKRYFEQSVKYSQKAIEIKSDGVSGHFWLGMSYAKWAEVHGILRSLFYAPRVLEQMNKVIELQPDFFRGIPWGLRASVYAFAPGRPISVGNMEKAESDMQEAFKYGNDFRTNYQIYAGILIHQKNWEKALEVINEGLAIPPDDSIKLIDDFSIDELKRYKEQVEKELAGR